eukprot:3875412-Prorocentrum_lima.AAC.1
MHHKDTASTDATGQNKNVRTTKKTQPHHRDTETKKRSHNTTTDPRPHHRRRKRYPPCGSN